LGYAYIINKEKTMVENPFWNKITFSPRVIEIAARKPHPEGQAQRGLAVGMNSR